jgi:hypothetical protein
MGYKHVDAALKAKLPKIDGHATSTLKLVLIAICQHADNKTNACFPSYRRLAKMTQLSRSAVGKAVIVLDGIGCFVFFKPGDVHGNSCHYVVDLKRLWDWAVSKEDSLDDEDDTCLPDEQGCLPEMQGLSRPETDMSPWATTCLCSDHNQSLTDSVNPSFESVTRSAAASQPVAAPAKQAENQNQSKPLNGLRRYSEPIPRTKPIHDSVTIQSDDPSKPHYVAPL